MKKFISILLLAAMVLLSACGSIKKAESSTIQIDKKGKVTSVLVENFAEDLYSESEMEEYIRSAIDKYNGENGSKSVSLDSCSVKKGQARVILEYAAREDYEGFNQMPLFLGTVQEALAAGYDFGSGFVDNKQNQLEGSKVPEKYPQANVIILQEPIQVMTAGNILCVSDNTEIAEGTLARVMAEEKEENENAQIMTADYAYIVYE